MTASRAGSPCHTIRRLRRPQAGRPCHSTRSHAFNHTLSLVRQEKTLAGHMLFITIPIMSVYLLQNSARRTLIAIGDNGTGFSVIEPSKEKDGQVITVNRCDTLTPYLGSGFRLSSARVFGAKVDASLITRILIVPNPVGVWPHSPGEMDSFLKIVGKRIPDGPATPGRAKVVWVLNNDTKIVFEQHPYHTNAPRMHTGPHWHLETPQHRHIRFLPGDPFPGEVILFT